MQDVSRDIIVRAADGDINAFETIFKNYADYVFNAALRIVRNREDAEEITQEVFITLHRKLKDFRFQSGLKTWVYRITVNTAINYAKREARMRDRSVEYDDTRGVPEAHSALDDKIERERNTGVIEGLLAGLTPEQRACIVLRNIEGLSYAEMAVVLKININAVRSRLKRAREKLLALRKGVVRDEL